MIWKKLFSYLNIRLYELRLQGRDLSLGAQFMRPCATSKQKA